MPLYAYRCENCHYEFETKQRMADDPLETCPECRKNELRRVINSVGIVFKGSGFYVTDNKSKNPAGKTGAETETTTAGESKSDSSTESKKSDTAKSDAPADKKSGDSKKKETA